MLRLYERKEQNMIVAKKIANTGLLSHDEIMKVLTNGLGGKFTGQKVLVLIPDHTRSVPLPELFQLMVEVLYDTRELNFMVALGTHPGYSEEGLNHLVGITAEERATTFKHVGLLNHAWDDPAALTSLGVIDQDEIRHLAGPSYHYSLPTEINIRINKAVLEHDHIIILGPTLPHEVVGFSGGAEVLLPRHLRAGHHQLHPLAGRAGDGAGDDRDQGYAGAGGDPCRDATPGDAGHVGRPDY